MIHGNIDLCKIICNVSDKSGKHAMHFKSGEAGCNMTNDFFHARKKGKEPIIIEHISMPFSAYFVHHLKKVL